jgi:hypothetical protein
MKQPRRPPCSAAIALPHKQCGKSRPLAWKVTRNRAKSTPPRWVMSGADQPPPHHHRQGVTRQVRVSLPLTPSRSAPRRAPGHRTPRYTVRTSRRGAGDPPYPVPPVGAGRHSRTQPWSREPESRTGRQDRKTCATPRRHGTRDALGPNGRPRFLTALRRRRARPADGRGTSPTTVVRSRWKATAPGRGLLSSGPVAGDKGRLGHSSEDCGTSAAVAGRAFAY